MQRLKGRVSMRHNGVHIIEFRCAEPLQPGCLQVDTS